MPDLTRYLHRARLAVGKGTRYRLGRGDFRGKEAWTDRESDCTGYLAWVLQVRRHRFGTWWARFLPWKRSPWLETSNIVADATGWQTVFARLPMPLPGCVVVYGDTGSRQGHVGIVAAVRSKWDFDVVDCSSGSWKAHKEAIVERRGKPFFRDDAVFCVLRQDFEESA